MQLKDRTGVRCDRCGLTLRLDFDYYSVDVRRSQAPQGRRPALQQLLRLPVARSRDWCATCFNALAQRVLAHQPPPRQGVRCELTGRPLSGPLLFVMIAHVTVRQGLVRSTPRLLEFCAGDDRYEEFATEAPPEAATWETKS